ncbi:unnamed protein product [Ceutorhynchus assimilis]|uniref:BHLH domain-containing protein n=1 Tax=Ceutorhynchus assimilis TaxID=467358 RepID=A0A9N9QD76_9CUCU|nr:unnamed protein product [Ceutorhynchus assimilis]
MRGRSTKGGRWVVTLTCCIFATPRKYRQNRLQSSLGLVVHKSCSISAATMLQYDAEISERLGLLDSNNNPSGAEKYSLRPRSMRKHLDFEEIPLIRSKKNCSKPQKSAPLSKYRRKTANARERSRMKEINQAFEALRKAVPQIAPDQQQNEKLTKITTLRLAMKYISALSAALSSPSSSQDLFSEMLLLESDGESLPPVSDHSSPSSGDFCVMDFDDSMDFSSEFSEHRLPFDSYLTDFS